MDCMHGPVAGLLARSPIYSKPVRPPWQTTTPQHRQHPETWGRLAAAYLIPPKPKEVRNPSSLPRPV